MSCGSGLHDPESEFSVSKDMDQNGGVLENREGRLDVPQDSLSVPSAKVVLRWHEHYDEHGGAVGPVFEIDVPTPDTFVRAPTLTITTSARFANDPAYVLGYVHDTDKGFKQWAPDMTDPPLERKQGVICGLVQLEDFTNPGGMKDKATKTVSLAIVKRCGGLADCELGQECSSGCCQQCVTGAPCLR